LALLKAFIYFVQTDNLITSVCDQVVRKDGLKGGDCTYVKELLHRSSDAATYTCSCDAKL
jgi:hypothetical protein